MHERSGAAISDGDTDRSGSVPGLRCAHGRVLDLSRPVVMGILNVTPDSFSDGGRFDAPEAALRHAAEMAGQGAAIIDIGGESTRPGAAPVPLEQELERVVPVIRALRDQTDALLSIDSSKPEVMREAVAAGAHIVNDVNALRADGALDAVRDSGAAVCLMHMRGEPRTMQRAPVYADVVAETREFLAQRIAACERVGIERARLLIDPGFGFGKTLRHNLELFHALPGFTTLAPVLVGLSRKSMLGQLTGRDTGQRLAASITAAALAVERGARIVRVHDVAATVDALKFVTALMEMDSDG